MRWHCCCSAALSVLWLVTAAGGAEFPYTAYVNTDDVYVRSGPGKNYYPTDKLNSGEPVEVYRHDPGGWLAVRPPQNSFSWVAARDLEIGEDGVGTVRRDRAVARVGSIFSDVRDSTQVHLDVGEKIQVMDVPPGSPWCKIAPPAGEFRWVHSKFVDREPPGDEPRTSARRTGAGRGNSADETADELAASDADAGDSLPRARPAVVLTGGHSRIDKSRARKSDPTNSRDGVSSGASPADQRGGTSDTRKVDSPEESLQRELNDIELELSAMAAEEITVWTFDDLRRRAEAALDRSRTALERGRARVLLSRIDRFDEIKQRHDLVATSQEDTNRHNRALGSSDVILQSTSPLGRFDGIGWLSPVVSRNAGSPQYALVDASRTVTAFVSPAPGVNLGDYVGKPVGVNGSSGYRADLRKQHINVQRVTLLDAGTTRR